MISVYHLHDFLAGATMDIAVPERLAELAMDHWSRDEYSLVADVIGTDELTEGRLLTTTSARPWWQNAEVTPRYVGACLSHPCRSTMPGDVLQTDDGHYVVAADGFVKLPIGDNSHG